MQIAGTTEDVWYPLGFERVPAVHFEVRPSDRQIFFARPPGWSGPTLEAVQEVTAQGAKFATRETSLHLAEPNMLTLNWGTGGHSMGHGPILNRWAAVARSSNQTASLKALGDLAPLSWDNFQEAAHYSFQAKPFGCIGKRNHGSHGRGKRYLTHPSNRFRYDVYQQFIEHRTEWRIHVYKNHVIGALRKEVLNGEPPTDLRPEFKFSRVNVIPKAVGWMAVEAAKRVGLDFAGVDIIKDEDTERFYVLETNSAPGMSPVTIRRLYMHIQEEYRG